MKMKLWMCRVFGHKYWPWWEGFSLKGRECRRCEKIEVRDIHDKV